MEKKIEEVKIPAVIGEIMSLLEEKRVNCLDNIEKRFEEYYKVNRLVYHKYRKNLLKITFPTNPSIIYHYKTKENTKHFFIYWLFTKYSNPRWQKEGINILNVLVNLEHAYLYKSEWKNFNNWWKQKVIEQNLAYRFKENHLYLWEIEFQANQLFQILRGMNFNNYNSLIGKLQTVKNTWKNIAKIEKIRKIEAINAAMKPISKAKKFEKYVDIWKDLRTSGKTVKEAYRELCKLYPDDKQLKKKNPEYFNRYMNNYI
ncbi:MAG: hypothetical protein ABI543_07855 [Ignavibacteria bacterium]